MKFLLLITTILLTLACQEQQFNNASNDPSGWKMVYRNGKDGEALAGNKEALIEAVRKGYEVRLGWGGRSSNDPSMSVEHVADAQFLTIKNGKDVYAQITPIISQNPNLASDTLGIVYRPNLLWASSKGTTGIADNLMYDRTLDKVAAQNKRASEVTWYVNYPAVSNDEPASPLWPSE